MANTSKVRLDESMSATDITITLMAVAVITLEEQMRGWLAEINRYHDPHRQISPYAKLQRQVEVFADWTILPWKADAAELFQSLRRQGVHFAREIMRLEAPG